MSRHQHLPLDTRWRRASRCQGSDSTCVDVTIRDALVAVRDSKDPSGGVLQFTVAEWRTFLDGVRDGEFEPPVTDHDGRADAESISS